MKRLFCLVIAISLSLSTFIVQVSAISDEKVDPNAFICVGTEDETTSRAATTFKVYNDKSTSYSGYSSSLPTLKTNYSNTSGATAGTYPTRKGVILVTTDAITMDIGHSAIVYSSGNVIEAKSTIIVGSNNWNTSKNDCAAVTARGTTRSQDANVANWCKNQVGKSYNLNFYNMSTREKFYCSHLVWAGFKDNYNINLNTSHYDISSSNTAIGPNEFVRVSTNRLFIIYLNNWKSKDFTTNSTIY